MNAPVVQGWCPGALKPMLSGDGYVVRIRPRSGRLEATQLRAIGELSARFGNGLVDFSARANIQMRGVSEATHTPLIGALRELDLVDDTIARETTRNIVVNPFWRDGDATMAIAGRLAALLEDGPALPGKFGFAVDLGAEPALQAASADIRIERAEAGGFMLRADGMATGCAVDGEDAAQRAVELARWFLASGGAPQGRGRMRRHLASGMRLPAAFCGNLRPLQQAGEPEPGPCGQGFLAGFEFGQANAAQLVALSETAPAFRATPWRMLLLEGMATAPAVEALVTAPGNALMRVFACTGAPACPQSFAPTRPLARELSAQLPEGKRLHVSGCAKGCAHPEAADFALTATPRGFVAAQNAKAGAAVDAIAHAPAEFADDPHLAFGTA